VTLTALAVGFLLAAAAAILAYRLGSLTGGGAAAAVLVGGLTFGAGGVLPGALLLLFFVSSSLLSRLGRRRKKGVAAQFEKGGRRDQGQVLANGSVAAASGPTGDGRAGDAAGWPALAAVNADTWAGGGVLSPADRLITTWRPAEPGPGRCLGLGVAAAAGG
jgi:uncharacterized membrane protein